MSKRTATAETCNPNQIEVKSMKRQKCYNVDTTGNKEIYSYMIKSFRTIYTPVIDAFCLHSTEPLIAIVCARTTLHQPITQHEVIVYTLEGDLVTRFEASDYTEMYLSATMMVARDTSRTMTRYNDYGMIKSKPNISCFCCDKNGDIYTVHRPSLWCIEGDRNSSIDIYSPDFECIQPFKIQVIRFIHSIRILDDCMAILSYNHGPIGELIIDYVISRYSLSKAELLETVVIHRGLSLHQQSIRSYIISFDPLCNIIIGGFPDEYCIAVWYIDGPLRYYKHRKYMDQLMGVDVTENFQLIRANRYSLSVYGDDDITKMITSSYEDYPAFF